LTAIMRGCQAGLRPEARSGNGEERKETTLIERSTSFPASTNRSIITQSSNLPALETSATPPPRPKEGETPSQPRNTRGSSLKTLASPSPTETGPKTRCRPTTATFLRPLLQLSKSIVFNPGSRALPRNWANRIG